jgi:hypothetical protein
MSEDRFVDGHYVVTTADAYIAHIRICRPNENPEVLMPDQLEGTLGRPYCGSLGEGCCHWGDWLRRSQGVVSSAVTPVCRLKCATALRFMSRLDASCRPVHRSDRIGDFRKISEENSDRATALGSDPVFSMGSSFQSGCRIFHRWCGPTNSGREDDHLDAKMRSNS